MLSPVLTFDDPKKIPALVTLYGGLQRPDVRKIMGRAIAGDLRKHFTELDRERANDLGGQRTHFWGQVRRSVQQPELVGGDGVKVSINHVGVAQRFFGGDIEREDGGFLTIPANPAAYGHRAREFSDLVAIYFDNGRRGLLMRPNSESTGGIGEVYYRLVRSVHQEPDPTVLPPEEEMQETALQAASDFVETIVERQS